MKIIIEPEDSPPPNSTPNRWTFEGEVPNITGMGELMRTISLILGYDPSQLEEIAPYEGTSFSNSCAIDEYMRTQASLTTEAPEDADS